MKKTATIRESRRGYLRRTRLYVVAPTSIDREVASANKADKVDMSYRDRPAASGKRCTTCASFIFPRACRVLDGDVGADGWCIAYSER